MKNLVSLLCRHHLFFAHVLLASIGTLAGTLCFFEGRMNRRNRGDVLSIWLLCLMTAFLAFALHHATRENPFLLPGRIFLVILFIGTLCRSTLVSRREKGAPYPVFIPLILVPVVFWAGLQSGLSYFSTFYPLAFSLVLIFIFSAKYHALSPVRIVVSFCSAAFLFFLLLWIFWWTARDIFPQQDAGGIFAFLLTLAVLPVIFITVHAEPAVDSFFTPTGKGTPDPVMEIPEGSVVLPFSMPDFTAKVISGCFQSIGEFEVLCTACFRNSGRQVFYFRRNDSALLSSKTMEVPDTFLKSAGVMERPFSRKMFHLAPGRIDAPLFLRKIVDWNECEFVLPVQEEGIPRVWVFVKRSGKGGTREETVERLFRHHELVQHVYSTSEVFKEDSDLRNISHDTEEKRLSYEMMCRKVEEVNNAFRDLKEKQQQLIESERWISFSQISVTLNHEINNPLSLVLGMAQFLQMKIGRGIRVSEKDFQKALSSIAEQGRRIMEIIKSLRRISVPVVEKYLPEIDMIKLEIKRKSPEE